MNLLNGEPEVNLATLNLVVNARHIIDQFSPHPCDYSGVSGGDGEERGKPGPEPDRLKIDVPFEEGLKRALKKDKPKEGWPEPEEPEPDNRS